MKKMKRCSIALGLALLLGGGTIAAGEPRHVAKRGKPFLATTAAAQLEEAGGNPRHVSKKKSLPTFDAILELGSLFRLPGRDVAPRDVCRRCELTFAPSGRELGPLRKPRRVERPQR